MIKLNMEQQPAKLSLEITDPVLRIETTPPQIQLSSEPAIVEINRTDGKLEINQYPCRYSIGFKNVFDFAYDAAQEGKRIVLETIGRIAAEGDRISHIESGENAIANIATESNFPEPPDVTWARTASPEINYQPGTIEFNPIYGKVNLNLKRGTVNLELQRGEVHGRISQYQSVRFWTTQSNVDLWI